MVYMEWKLYNYCITLFITQVVLVRFIYMIACLMFMLLKKITQFYKNKLKTINYLNNMYKIGKQSSDGWIEAGFTMVLHKKKYIHQIHSKQ